MSMWQPESQEEYDHYEGAAEQSEPHPDAPQSAEGEAAPNLATNFQAKAIEHDRKWVEENTVTPEPQQPKTEERQLDRIFRELEQHSDTHDDPEGLEDAYNPVAESWLKPRIRQLIRTERVSELEWVRLETEVTPKGAQGIEARIAELKGENQ